MSTKTVLMVVAVQLAVITLVLVAILVRSTPEEPTSWREPPWYPPQTLDVTVTQPKDCSTGTAMHRALCRTTP